MGLLDVKKLSLLLITMILLCFCGSCKRNTSANRIEKGLKESIIAYYSEGDYDASKNNSYLNVVEIDTIEGYRLFRLYDDFLNIKEPDNLKFYRKIKNIKVLFKLNDFNFNDSVLENHMFNSESDLIYDPKETLIIMNMDYEVISSVYHTGYLPLDSLKKEYPSKFEKIE